MLPPIPLWDSLRLTLLVAAVGGGFLYCFFRRAWRRLRVAYGAAVAALLLAHVAWNVGRLDYDVSYWGAAIASAGLLLSAFVVASLPVAGALRVLLTRVLLVRRDDLPKVEARGSTPRLSRRTLVQGMTALVPLTAFGAGVDGFVQARAPVNSPCVRFRYPDLHPDLEGFTILQLSDLHLGMSKQLGDLERVLAPFDRWDRRPDLIVFTGDVAEDLRQLPEALALAASLRPRSGVLACLGNHEYLRDIRVARPIYEKSSVPLLVNRGLSLPVGRAKLWVGGIDDPISVHTDVRPFLRNAVDRAMRDAPSETFRLLLAHRPEAFEAAVTHDVDLTLSGHTHGGQIGYNGKSAFQPLYEDGYLWGKYARGTSRLYTTSGFGSWFPFRLGCPAEAPLIVLGRA